MREAYPQLDIVRAMSASSRGETLCLFHDERGRTHGLMEFAVAPDMNQAWIDGEIALRNMRGWKGPTSIVLVPNPNGVQRNRRAMVCPNCERRCQKLTFVGSWRCRACDGLLDRRQLVSPETRKAEKLAKLKEQLAEGRRKGQHQAQFDHLTAEAEQLTQELKGKRPRMPAQEHQLILETEWISIAEYHERPSVQHLPVPSEEQRRRPGGWLDETEARRAPVPRTPPEAAPPGHSAKAPVIRCNPYADHVRESDDPDEVSVGDM